MFLIHSNSYLLSLSLSPFLCVGERSLLLLLSVIYLSIYIYIRVSRLPSSSLNMIVKSSAACIGGCEEKKKMVNMKKQSMVSMRSRLMMINDGFGCRRRKQVERYHCCCLVLNFIESPGKRGEMLLRYHNLTLRLVQLECKHLLHSYALSVAPITFL